MNDVFDAAVIGAGVVGLAVAAEIASLGRQVVVLERNDAFGRETSSRNSEVVHSGIYYRPGSLKARLCVEGRERLYALCARQGVPCNRIGKLIVACDAGEHGDLDRLRRNAHDNAVTDVVMLGTSEIRRMEPAVRASAALWSPSTGIIDSHRLMAYWEWCARERGAVISYRSPVVAVERGARGYRVVVSQQGGTIGVEAAAVVNAAGLASDRVAAMAGVDVDAAGYRLHPNKGQYFSVTGGAPRVTRLVYPVPSSREGELGIHVTVDLVGNMRLGPDARYVPEPEYSVDPGLAGVFLRSVSRFLPGIAREHLQPGTCGVRPRLNGPGEDVRDFVIAEESSLGLPGWINLVGIESPGLTASPAIARTVVELLRDRGYL